MATPMPLAAQPDTTLENMSLQKQLLYRQYALGEMSLDEVSERVAAITPPRRRLPAAYGVAKVLAFILTALVIPTWATRRTDD